MRLAIFSDIHGNDLALNAVLDDIERQGGVDETWILGDIVALGPAPVEVLQRLEALDNARFIRGNTDRYTCTGDRPPPSMAEAEADPAKLVPLVECAGTFAWTQGAVTQAGWLDWLSELPLTVSTILPDGTSVLGVHASPKNDDGLGFRLGLTDAALLEVLGDCDADLIFAGHHHRPLDVTLNGHHIVNIGSVSNPVPPDLRASYVILDADETGYEVTFHRVDYDREAVVAALERLRHPGANYIIDHLRGRRQ